MSKHHGLRDAISNLPVIDPHDSTVGDVIGQDNLDNIVKLAERYFARLQVKHSAIKVHRGDTPENARKRYRAGGFGVYGSPSAKKAFDQYLSLFEEQS